MPRFANGVVSCLGCSDAVEKSGTKCIVYPCRVGKASKKSLKEVVQKAEHV